MLDCHIKSFLIEPGRVLGRKLRPLTLAHYWILEAINSPYVRGEKPSYSDMVIAVFALSFPASVSRWLLMHQNLYKRILKAWGWLYKGGDPISDLASFAAYWDAYTEMPDKWPKKGSPKESCLPTSINIAWAIIGKVGERRAWSMPMPLALAYLVAESEFNGGEYKSERQKAIAKLNQEAENG